MKKSLIHGFIMFIYLLNVLYSMNEPKGININDVIEMQDINPIFGGKVENVDLNMQQLDIRIKQKCVTHFIK